MQSRASRLQSRSLLFIVTLTLTIIINQVIIQYDIGLQRDDAQLINLAGRQRMLSQRISKLTAFLYYKENVAQLSGSYNLDTLRNLVDKWVGVHEFLIRKNQQENKSKAIDSLLQLNTPRVQQMATATRWVLADTSPDNVRKAIASIAEVELPFLLTMERTVNTYQREAEENLDFLKKIQLNLALLSIALLALQFGYLFYPVARELEAANNNLQALNRKVQHERALLRTIIDNIPVNIYVKDTDLRKILANKAEYEYTGFSREEDLLGKKDADVYPAETALISEQEDVYVLQGNSIVGRETFNVRKDGTKHWFMVSKVPLTHEGEITGLVGISVDVTATKLAQDALAQKERLYRLVSENSQDVISLHALDGTFEYISPSCIDLHGYTPEELIGKSGTDFMHPDDAQKMQALAPAIQQKMQQRLPIEPIQFRLASKHRGMVWVENLIKPVYTDHQLSGFQSTVRDISVRKQYEMDLQQAKEKAEEATLAKSRFLSMMSHEIRTPINGIMGLTHLLLEEQPRPDQLGRLNLLKFSSENLLRIINDILDFSKMEAGKMALEIIPFNLRETIEHYANVLRPRAAEKGIALNTTIASAVPAVVAGDPVRLGQVLNNLLGNAIKFTEKGAVTLTISHLGSQGTRHHLRFVVSDTGIGIAAEKLDSVFESFSQADSDTTRKYGGTGLGLSITRDLLQLMGSQITVQSKPGEGTTFQFDLQLEEATIDTATRQSAAGQITRRKAQRILLVEDNPVNQEVAMSFLTKWGHEVTLAHNGAEAVEKIQSRAFDLVFMDLHMPGMDGYEATRAIRAKTGSYYQQVPIVALTASTTGPAKEKTKEVGMNGMLVKPFRPEELRHWVENPTAPGTAATEQNTAFAKLEEYTGGDRAFAQKLLTLFIGNLNELAAAYEKAIHQHDSTIFDAALHKAKTTLSLLDSDDVTQAINHAKVDFEHGDYQSRHPTFHSSIQQLITNIEKEIQKLAEM